MLRNEPMEGKLSLYRQQVRAPELRAPSGPAAALTGGGAGPAVAVARLRAVAGAGKSRKGRALRFEAQRPR